MDNVPPDLLYRLDSLADVLRETLMIGQVLWRILASIEVRVLDVDWIVPRVKLAPDEVKRHLIEDLGLVNESLRVEVHLVVINFSVFVENLGMVREIQMRNE